MNKSLGVLVCLLLLSSPGGAQLRNFQIGTGLGTNLLIAETSLQNSTLSPSFSIFGQLPLSDLISARIEMGYGQLLFEPPNSSIKSTFIPIELSGNLKLFQRDFIQPFVSLGIGSLYSAVIGSEHAKNVGFLSAGAGILAPFNSRFIFSLEGRFVYTSEDNFNHMIGGMNDGFFSFKSGLFFALKRDKGPFQKKPQEEELPVISTLMMEKPSHDEILEQIRLRSKITVLRQKIKAADSVHVAIMDELRKKDAQIEQLNSQIAEIKRMQRGISGKTEETLVAGNRSVKVEDNYQRALNLFKAKKYNQAISEFQYLGSNFPNHPLYANFIYWIGECYYGLKEFQKALTYFAQVKAIGQNPKVDDALLMSGLCYRRLGKISEARGQFQELLQSFPDSEYSPVAKRYLKSISRIAIS